MADAAEVLMVQDLLPPEAATDGWDAAKIGVYLDSGQTLYQSVALYWESKAARLYTMIDVNESGSVRSLSKVYDHAKAMAEYWRDRDKVQKSEEESAANSVTRIHKITRM